MSVWVIIGASKGLGAALVQRILQQDSSTVFACSRNPNESDELLQLASPNKTRLHLVQLDVTEETSVKKGAEVISAAAGGKVDWLLYNAAHFESMKIATRELKTVVNISSSAASTSTFSDLVQNRESPRLAYAKFMGAYRASKAALNSITVSWALDLTPDTGFKFVALHPGGIKSESGLRAYRELGIDTENFGLEIMSPTECADKVLHVMTNLKPSDSGKFLTYKGESMPF